MKFPRPILNNKAANELSALITDARIRLAGVDLTKVLQDPDMAPLRAYRVPVKHLVTLSDADIMRLASATEEQVKEHTDGKSYRRP